MNMPFSQRRGETCWNITDQLVQTLSMRMARRHRLARRPWRPRRPCARRIELPKATKGACPAGYKFSAKKKGCAKVSCGTGSVWSVEQHTCIDGHSAALTTTSTPKR